MTKAPVRFLIISDTHNYLPGNDPSQAFRFPLPKVDVVLHCGDLTENGSTESYKRALSMFCSIEAELKLVIPGNHDIDLDPAYWASQGGSNADHEAACSLLQTSAEAKRANVTFLEEGTHTFTLSSGAKFSLYASPWTPKYGESAFQYATAEDRFNPDTPNEYKNTSSLSSVIPHDVNIVMTHGPAQYILDRTTDSGSGGCPHLRRALCRVKPKLHCFGHIHGGYGAARMGWRGAGCDEEEFAPPGDDALFLCENIFVGKNSAKRKGYATVGASTLRGASDGQYMLAINAAIMAGEDEPVNAPWLVELDL